MGEQILELLIYLSNIMKIDFQFKAINLSS